MLDVLSLTRIVRAMTNEAQKTVLAIDTALCGVSVGVVTANGHIVTRLIETQRGQAAMLVPTIQEVLSEAEIGFHDIDLIVTTKGPGSFTGLRIGLSTARTLGLALDIPVVGISTLDVMARHYKSPCPQAGGRDETYKPLLIVLETKRQDFYARYYDQDLNPLSDAFADDASVILERAPKESFNIGGDCLIRFQETVSGDFSVLDAMMQPDPVLMVQLGLEQYEKEGYQGAPQPVYLRGADVSQPKNPPRKLAAKS